MEASLKLGNGNWAVKEDSLLAYDDVGGKFRPLPFDFTRASSATVVNKQGLIETVGSGIPRIDFSDDVNGALLLEPQSTNLITQSEDYSSFTQNGCSVISDNISSVGGGLADKIQEDSLNTNKHIRPQSISITSGQSYILSAWFKTDNCDVIALREGSSSGDSITYKFSTGTTSTNGTRWTTLNVVNFSNGWRRIDAKYTSTSTASMNFRVHLLGNNYNQLINPNPSTYVYQGDGASGVYMWGLMVEQNSYPNSYIPTSGAISTRLRDIATNSGIGSLIGQTEGSVFFDLNTTLKNYSVISISDGTNANRVVFYFSAVLNQIASYITKSNVNSSTISSIVNSYPNSNYKVVIKYNSIGFYIFANGGLIGTILSNYSFPNNTLNEIKLSSPDNSNFFEGKVKNIIVYNQSLTDSEAIALTTI